MATIPLDPVQVERVKAIAGSIADAVQAFIDLHSTVSVERTVLRLYGVDGVNDDGTPLPNLIVDLARRQQVLAEGISPFFARAMLACGRNVQATAELLSQGMPDLSRGRNISPDAVAAREVQLAETALAQLKRTAAAKWAKQLQTPVPTQPWRYIIVATGNIYSDRTQAESAVFNGADIIAVIRSTAQSLLDYVPYGPTTEGFGGTYATQANFRIMREALDRAGSGSGRYIRLVNYSSGLCMAEIAACAALEDLDILLNDSMYGILFRDINMKRTFVDQYFSRLICAAADILINTGEDNYLTTTDAIEAAHTVTASQLINEAMARKARLQSRQLGIGHAFEIDPQVPNAFLYELAHAQLARQLFPEAPLKFMPPTKHKSPDIFHAHVLDAMFNLASITTRQGIHLAGILTEAIHTPLMQDRFQSLANINTVFNMARNLGEEIEFRPDGFIARRAQSVLDQAETMLVEIREIGLMNAISQGRFAGISRPQEGGKGREGVFRKAPGYSNPVLQMLEQESS